MAEIQGAVVRREGDAAVVRVDESVYEQAAVLRAAYWMIDRAYVIVTRAAPGTLEVHLRAKHARPSLERPRPDDPFELAGELANALLEHQLREEVARRTAGIREMLLEKAFADNGAFDEPPVGDARDPVAKQDGPAWPQR